MKELRWFCPLMLAGAMMLPTSVLAQNQPPAPPDQALQPTQPQQGQRQQTQQRQRGQQGQQGQPGQQGQQQGEYAANDELVNYLAANLFLANKAEVAFSQAAMEKLTAPPLKQLAQRIAQEHEQVNQQLVQAMPELKALQQMEFSGQPRGGQAGEDASLSQLRQDDFLDGAALRLLSIKQRAVGNQLQMTQQMLDEYSGQDYDMGFLGNQIVAHTWLAAELQALEGIGPQPFQQIVRQTQESVDQHLKTARQFAERIENDRARQGQAQQQQRPDGQPVRR